MKFFQNRFFQSCFLVIMVLGIVYAQRTKRDLEQKRRRLLENIRHTKSELSETRQEKKNTEKKYAKIQENIEQKEHKIETVSEVISSSSELVERNYEVVNALSNDLIRVKSDYAAVMRRGFRQKLNYNLLGFLFSSDNFNQLYTRLHYLRQIDRFRKRQVKAILDTRADLESSIVALEQGMARKADEISAIEAQKEALGQKLTKEEQKLDDLKHQEQKLNKELRRQEERHEKLSAAIDNIIKMEIEERAKTARVAAEATKKMRKREKASETKIQNTTASSKKEEESIVIKETPEVKALSDNFRNNRGKLPWPVRSGAVVRKFGRQPHPTLHNIMTSNNGIDIRTNPAADVTAVFAGKVVAVQFIPGSNYLVIIQHGSYYTVYSNLDRTYIHKGDEVTLRQTIGKVADDIVHFELWQNRSRENPSNWIAK